MSATNKHYQCNGCRMLCAILTNFYAKEIPTPVEKQECILRKKRAKAIWTDKTDIINRPPKADMDDILNI